MTSLDEDIVKQLGDIKSEAQKRQENASKSVLLDVHPPVHTPTDEEKATYDDKLKAVLDLYDMQERCMFTVIVLGDLAKAIREKQSVYEGNKIEVGIPDKYLTAEIKSLFKTWKFEEKPYGYRYYYTPPTKWKVRFPIDIIVYKKHWKFFDNPDFGFFGTEMLHIPNPFEDYWKSRNLIK